MMSCISHATKHAYTHVYHLSLHMRLIKMTTNSQYCYRLLYHIILVLHFLHVHEINYYSATCITHVAPGDKSVTSNT